MDRRRLRCPAGATGRRARSSDRAGRWSCCGGWSTRGSRPPGATLQLGPMDDGELRELLVAADPVPLRPDEVQSLVSRAAGSPLVLDALVRLGRERGAVDDLPDSLEALIAAEIDVLEPLPAAAAELRVGAGPQLQPAGVAAAARAMTASRSTRASRAELRQFVEFDPSGVGPVPPGRGPGRRVPRAAVPPSAGAAPPGRAGDGAGRGRERRLRRRSPLGALLRGRRPRAGVALRAPRRLERPGFATPTTTRPRLYRRALEAGRRLPEVEPDELRDTWTALGDVLEQAGLPEDALDAYRRATALAGDDDVRASSAPPQAGARSGAVRSVRCCPPGAQRRRAGARDATERRRRAGSGGRRRRMRAIVRQGQEQPRRALVAAQEPRRMPSGSASCATLPRRFNVIDWAHVFLGELDQAVHHRRVVRDPRVARRAAPSGGRAREPRSSSCTGRVDGTRRSTATSERTMPM